MVDESYQGLVDRATEFEALQGQPGERLKLCSLLVVLSESLERLRVRVAAFEKMVEPKCPK